MLQIVCVSKHYYRTATNHPELAWTYRCQHCGITAQNIGNDMEVVPTCVA